MLDIIDATLTPTAQLIIRCEKMSLLLGFVTGTLLECVRDENLTDRQKAPILDLLSRLSSEIEELYYSKEPSNS